ncbi:MAG: Bifunctional phosphoglucose/phosphomannose isomerase [Acidimicrobiales bacterium]|nr:Bifunctional phosphoglucose/phosphomannose isomerase [Acidimicrobiales bacterium]
MVVAGRLDSLGMLEATLGLPEQIAAAAAASSEVDRLPERDDIANVVVVGMGASSLAGEVLAAVAGPFMSVPVVVSRGHELPSFVDESTLVIAISFSGDTEETNQAVLTAAEAGGQLLAVTKGGELARLVSTWEAPVLRVPADLPAPRAGLGALAVPPLLALERIGLFPGASSWVDEAVVQLQRRRDQLGAAQSPAASLARSIGTTMPIVYGGGALGGVAASRWKAQCNENAKTPAWSGVLPDVLHDEVCGWAQHGDVTRQILSLVLLRHDHEHPQVARGFDEVVRWTEEVVADIHTVRAAGEGTLAQLLDLLLFGDVVSLELAFQAGIDPGPTPVLDDIRAALAG